MDASLQRVLNYYAITPLQIESLSKISKIEAEEGIFALKKTKMNSGQTERFQETLRFFERNQFPGVAPIIPASNGERYVRDIDGETVFYLSEWGRGGLEGKREKDYFQALAIFHRSTQYHVPVDEEMWEERGTSLREWKNEKMQQLEAYAEEIERKEYYSPFDWAVLMHFPLLYECYDKSMRYFEEWEELAREKGELKVARCHGRPEPSHFILDRYGNFQFINVEHADTGHPVYDLAYLYKKCTEQKRWEHVNGVDWLSTYASFCPTDDGDRALLSSMLLEPVDFYELLSYPGHRSSGEQPGLVQELEAKVWMLEKIKDDIESWPQPVQDE
ncbi:hypothetical protein [Alteribacillus sp. HJP-4]|uniref:hypothetical protein n=1 Tax=Alteribacillus sp. HJP-4 TaxID=2775394 RepID=UPI0035CD2ACE